MTDKSQQSGPSTGELVESGPIRDPKTGRLVKGAKLNPSGRPKGSRNVLSKSVLGTYAKEAANGDFERVMADLKAHNPAAYAKLLNDAAMKEAERSAEQGHSGLCAECGGDVVRTVLSVQFVDVGDDHPAKQEACQLALSSEEVPSETA